MSSDSLDYANRWRSPHAEPPRHGDRKSCSTRCEISFPGRGYGCPNITDIVTPSCLFPLFSVRIGHNFPHEHQNRLCDHNSESALRDGRQGVGFAELCSGAKIPPGACVLVHRLPYPPVGRRYLFARGSEPPARPQFRSRHFDPVGKWSHSEISGPAPKFLSGSAIAGCRCDRIRTPPRSNSSDSLDYVNRWRSPHAEPPSHGDRKLCSTRGEISSPAKELGITFRTGIGIAYVTTIWNRHSEMVDKALVSRNSVPGQKSPPERIWVPEHRRYSHPLRFIPTPSAKELGITFRTGIGIAYVTTIRNRHSETVDKALVS
ncbi:hypothetical protein Taro_050422 [Colocasia esculenta]|uniref:Uncharacterized protein n=1 Tax=Colocasia esculenta TaxID=4460 RepID=A0A843XDX7_COLES|nr:hypothetical protein [Colocasia esculenta]